MRQARSFEPLVAVNFVIADDVTDAISKDFRTSTGKRGYTGGFQLLQSLTNGKFCALGEIRDLHHGERFKMHLRKTLLQSRDYVQTVCDGKITMKPTDDVKLGDCSALAGSGGPERL